VSDLEYGVVDGVATIRLNRPQARNAFTVEMTGLWADAVREAQDDPAVAVVVLTGTGTAFCAGADLGSELSRRPTPLDAKTTLHEKIHRIARAVADLDKPLIAALNGVAVGAGLDMALMCDLRIAARSARFAETYVRLGIAPGNGGAWFLPRIVGEAKALELLLTGDFVDAEEALRIGLVNRVVADDELTAHVAALARALADAPPLAVRTIKRTVRQSAGLDLRTALDLVSSHMAVLRTSDDAAEAYAALTERRPGRFGGT
jgi:enoyl-CoA hydratase/carnithine racemase